MSCFTDQAAEVPEWLMQEFATMFDPNSFQNTNFSDDTGEPIAEARFQGVPGIPVFCVPSASDQSFSDILKSLIDSETQPTVASEEAPSKPGTSAAPQGKE